MSEEDRKLAIEMYTELFEEAPDEQSLIQYLVSPTKQAVIVARAYNLVASASEKAAKSNAEPEFVKLIENIGNEYLDSVEEVPEEEDIFSDENQFSLFGDFETGEPEAEPEAESEPAVEPEADAEPEAVTESEPAAEYEPELFVPVSDEPAEEIPAQQEVPAAEVEEPSVADETPAQAAEIPADETESPAVEEPGQPADIEKPAEDAAVDAFMQEYRSPVEEEEVKFEVPAELAREEEAPVIEFAETPAQSEDIPAAEFEKPEKPKKEKKEKKSRKEKKAEAAASAAPVKTEKKTNPFLLILFLIFAIPVGLICTAVLLIPTAICLAAAAGLIFIGVYVFSYLSIGFPVLSDKLVIIGIGIVLLALGLFFLWSFIWFIGAVIIGLISKIVALGKKICVREVRVNG